MALHVDRQQGLLHDVLRVDGALHDLAAGEAAHEASRPAQEFRIGSFISCERGAQNPGKFGFAVTVQACLLPNTSARPLVMVVMSPSVLRAPLCQSRGANMARTFPIPPMRASR